jgi:NAD(P)-dependent dehydrogenase (short-subunit alcohol dehydrogenase family)
VPAARLSAFYRTAFVTGASTGLGRAFAEMLMAEGVRVWGTSRDVRRLEPLAIDGVTFRGEAGSDKAAGDKGAGNQTGPDKGGRGK